MKHLITRLTMALLGLSPIPAWALEAGNGKAIEPDDFRIATFQVSCWDAGVKAAKDAEGVITIIKTGYKKDTNGFREGNLVYFDPSITTAEKLSEEVSKKCRSAKLVTEEIDKPEGVTTLILNTPWVTDGDCFQIRFGPGKGRSFDVSFEDLPETWSLAGAKAGTLRGVADETIINVQTDSSLRPKGRTHQRKASITLVTRDTQTGQETKTKIPFMIANFQGSFTPEAQASSKASVKTENGKRLFILSGQSNMALLDPGISFTPTVEAAFGKDGIIVVKDAKGSMPIRRWYKDWKPENGVKPKGNGDLYDRLMAKVNAAIQGENIQTVTFLWLQGERDANEKHGTVYAESFEGLVKQLAGDLKRDDINIVIGRINDHSMNNKSHRHWTKVRDAQVEVAGSFAKGVWVDTDDLNGPGNGIHATKDGYRILGERLAKSAIELIGK